MHQITRTITTQLETALDALSYCVDYYAPNPTSAAAAQLHDLAHLVELYWQACVICDAMEVERPAEAILHAIYYAIGARANALRNIAADRAADVNGAETRGGAAIMETVL